MDPICCLKPAEKPYCTCSFDELFAVIGRKWALVILNLLNNYRTLGYNQMLNKISGITPKAFGDKLKLLEEKELVEKNTNRKPLRTTYALTPKGEEFLLSLLKFFSPRT